MRSYTAGRRCRYGQLLLSFLQFAYISLPVVYLWFTGKKQGHQCSKRFPKENNYHNPVSQIVHAAKICGVKVIL
jgi:hypothetical protein